MFEVVCVVFCCVVLCWIMCCCVETVKIYSIHPSHQFVEFMIHAVGEYFSLLTASSYSMPPPPPLRTTTTTVGISK